MQPSRKIIIGGNWKSHNTLKDSQNLINNVINNLKFDASKIEVVVSPVFLHVPWVLENVRKDVQVAAQNCSLTPFGQFTGEIAAQHIKDFGLNWTIVGHSERRKFYGETDEIVAAKTRIALDNGLQVIACIGEKLEERESNQTMTVIERQLDANTNNKLLYKH